MQIEHRNACHLVRAEAEIFGVGPDDRVFQGFSIAFDASVEEVWLAFDSGAALVVGTKEMVQSGPALAGVLTEAGVTVFSTVPTLLAMIEGDLPTVRLLILGGEPCPQDLVKRWCRPGRRMVNTYGPTEATVIATFADCDPARPVTIGRPVPGYSVHLLDEQPPARARGRARRDLHRRAGRGAGIPRPARADPREVRRRPVRDVGRRPRAALQVGRPRPAQRRRRDRVPGPDRLAGEAPRVPDRAVGDRVGLARTPRRARLRGDAPRGRARPAATGGLRRAPRPVGRSTPAPCSIRSGRGCRRTWSPTRFETLDALPTLPSGKVDRRACPRPALRFEATEAPPEPVGRTGLRAEDRDGLGGALRPAARDASDDDFFRDLGGHSLLAARVVSELRTDPDLRDLSVIDVYNHPTIEALAAKLEADRAARRGRRRRGPGRTRRRGRVPRRFTGRRPRVLRSAALAQFLALYFVLGFFSLQWLAPYLTYTWLIDHGAGDRRASLLVSLSILLAVYPAMLAASIAVKWLVIGRFKAGEYPLWGV